MFYTVEITHQPAGSLPMPGIPCPACGEEKMVMEFYTERSEAIFYVSTQPAACGDAVCQHCAHEVDFLDLKGDLKIFHTEHHKAYRGKFIFKFKKWFVLGVGGLLLAGFVNLGLVKLAQHEKDKQKAIQSVMRKAQYENPQIGAVYYVRDFTAKESDATGGAMTHTWLKLVRLEGEKLIFQKHHRHLAFHEMLNSENAEYDPAGFSDQHVGVYRNPRYDNLLHLEKDRRHGTSFEIMKINLP